MQQFYNQATLIAIYSIYAISLNVLLGFTGQLSVAHAAFGAVGGYIAAYLGLDHGWAFIPCLLIGAAGAGVAGMLASLPASYLDVPEGRAVARDEPAVKLVAPHLVVSDREESDRQVEADDDRGKDAVGPASAHAQGQPVLASPERGRQRSAICRRSLIIRS